MASSAESVHAGIYAALDVGGAGDWLEVLRVDAASYTAQVVEVHAVWDWADVVGVEGSMGQRGAEGGAANVSVAVGERRAGPEPAAVVVGEVAGEMVCLGQLGAAGQPLAAVVLLAETDLKPARDAIRVVDLAGTLFHVRL